MQRSTARVSQHAKHRRYAAAARQARQVKLINMSGTVAARQARQGDALTLVTPNHMRRRMRPARRPDLSERYIGASGASAGLGKQHLYLEQCADRVI